MCVYIYIFFLEFYKKLSQELVSILNPDDIIGYKPIYLPALKQNFMNYTVITSNNGTGGSILMKVLSKLNSSYDENISLLNSFKGSRYHLEPHI